MTCRQVSTYNGTVGSGKTGGGGYTTEAECLQACQEGACCEGTTCTIKPQCQCQGEGKTFKGVGTVCTAGTCLPCGCSAGSGPSSFTVSITNAAFSLFTGNSGNLFYDEMNSGGSCEADSSVVQWLNETAVPLSLFSTLPPSDNFSGSATYSGSSQTQSPFGSVEVMCRAVFQCDGRVDVELMWCPSTSNLSACLAYVDRPIPITGSGLEFCTFTSKSLSVSLLFRQLHYTQNTQAMTINGIGVRTCKGNIGDVASLAVSRYFNGTVTVAANPLP